MGKRDEAYRMEAVTRARAFKRSWVDMAEALVEVRKNGWFQRWGYETLHGYALEELHIKRSTVVKLSGCYTALDLHVPHVLQCDGFAQSMPDMDAVEYFARAVDPPAREGEAPPPPPPPDVVEQLKQAIFEDHVSSPSLRRRFNPILNPKPETDPRAELVERIRSSAQRLEAMLANVEGLSAETVEHVTRALEELRRDLDALKVCR